MNHRSTLALRHTSTLLLTALMALPLLDTAYAQDASPESAALTAKKFEADLAEAEARLQKALKEAAEYKKASLEAVDGELVNAAKEKAIAEAAKAKAEAEKAALAAVLPAPSTKALEGKVDVDDKAGYFAEILAYESVRENADKIAEEVRPFLPPGHPLYLLKDADQLGTAFQIAHLSTRIGVFDRALNELTQKYTIDDDGKFVVKEAAGLAALAAIPAVLGTLADVAALFRTDLSIKGRQTSVASDALLLAVSRAIQYPSTAKVAGAPALKVIRPSSSLDAQTVILGEIKAVERKALAAAQTAAQIKSLVKQKDATLENLQAELSTAQAALDAISLAAATERKDIKLEIARLRTARDGTKDAPERARYAQEILQQEGLLQKSFNEETAARAPMEKGLQQKKQDIVREKRQKAEYELVVTRFETAIQGFLTFSSKLTAIPESGGTSLLASLAEASLLAGSDPKAVFLHVAVAGQGGEMETRKSTWTSGTVFHRAGTACTYLLTARDGSILRSGLVVADVQAKEGVRTSSSAVKR